MMTRSVESYSLQMHLIRINGYTHTALYSNSHGTYVEKPIIGIPAETITVTITEAVTKEELEDD